MVIDSLINIPSTERYRSRIIAHRANIGGPNPDVENNPEQIDKCIAEGYDVEIDLRYDDLTKTLWLGHDSPDYKVTWYWLAQRIRYLWVHCKTYNTLCELSDQSLPKERGYDVDTGGCNYFWHQEDDYTITSNNIIWAYPGKPYSDIKMLKDNPNLSNTVIVMPEWNKMDWESLQVLRCYGICTDYPEKLK